MTDKTQTREAKLIIMAAVRKMQPEPVALYWHQHKADEETGEVTFCTWAVLTPACLQ